MASSPRPQVVRQSSRVPGGFETDEDLSPVKSSYDRDEIAPTAETSNSQNLPIHAPSPSRRINLHAMGGEGPSQMVEEGNTLDEKAMARRLMDVDSSFLPEVSPVGQATKAGQDDTYVFGERLMRQGADATEEVIETSDSAQEHSTEEVQQPEVSPGSPVTPPDHYKTPAPGREEMLQQSFEGTPDDNPLNTSSLETISSSPTAAAAARTVSRAVSLASNQSYDTAQRMERNESLDHHIHGPEGDHDLTPRKVRNESSNFSRNDSMSSTRSLHIQGNDVPKSTENDDDKTSNSRKRPRYLNSQQGSQRSSYSSYTTTSTEGGSDATLGADFALQSGGAAPFAGSTSSRPGMDVRAMSLGSMASGISDLSDGNDRIRAGAGQTLGDLSTVDEEDASRGEIRPGSRDNAAAPETPRATSRNLSTPTDTVIAQRVGDVRVPGTLAREYQNRHRPSSPDKRNGEAPGTITRNGKNMTLKEQSGTIDRLEKENFGLKLKITFLDDALNQRSEEGVKAMISENVDLRTAKIKSAKENRELKRFIKDLERKLKEKTDELATYIKNATAEKDKATTPQESQELEEEILYLRDQMKTYEVNIETMRHESFAREGERRRLAEILRNMELRGGRGSDLDTRDEKVSNIGFYSMRILTSSGRKCGRTCLRPKQHGESKPMKTIEGFARNCGGLKVTDNPPSVPARPAICIVSVAVKSFHQPSLNRASQRWIVQAPQALRVRL